MLILRRKEDYKNIPKDKQEIINKYLTNASRAAPFYENKFGNSPISISNYYNLPLLRPSDLIESPDSLVADSKSVVQVCSSSGTCGGHKLIFRTMNDIELNVESSKNILSFCGIKKSDKILLAQPFDMWGFGHDVLRAFQNLGSLSYPVGLSGTPEFGLWLLSERGCNILFTTPSKAVFIAELALNKDLLRKVKVDCVLSAGEGVIQVQRERIKELLGAEIFGTYGCEETSGISSECSCHDGYHITDDNIIIEVLDEETLMPCEGNKGAIALTKLFYTGTVMLRYLIGDLVEIEETPCRCGRSGPRLRVLGRAKELSCVENYEVPLFFKVPLAAIEGAIKSVMGYLPIYQIIVKKGEKKALLSIKIHSINPIEGNMCDKIAESILTLKIADFDYDIEVQISDSIVQFQTTLRGKMPKVLDWTKK